MSSEILAPKCTPLGAGHPKLLHLEMPLCCCRSVLRRGDDHVYHIGNDDSPRPQLPLSQARHVSHVAVGNDGVFLLPRILTKLR